MILSPEGGHEIQLSILADIGGIFSDPLMVEKAIEANSFTELLSVIKS
jgi:hypothetical protein